MEGVLWLKEDGKKSWKKRYFLLRASGLYYVPKGKAKVSSHSAFFLHSLFLHLLFPMWYHSPHNPHNKHIDVLTQTRQSVAVIHIDSTVSKGLHSVLRVLLNACSCDSETLKQY